jgi:hypothetical protein
LEPKINLEEIIMISDILFEAIEEIERYQNDFSECYDDLREEIDAVKDAMKALKIKLDTPPLPHSSRVPSL